MKPTPKQTGNASTAPSANKARGGAHSAKISTDKGRGGIKELYCSHPTGGRGQGTQANGGAF